jgi:2-keto-3-deoxy-L-rhamnonate aldolase RhmA
VRKGISLSTPAHENQSILEAMEKTAHACREQGKACGCVAGNSHAASIALQMGYRVIVGGGDIRLLRSGAAQRLEELRAAVESMDS